MCRFLVKKIAHFHSGTKSLKINKLKQSLVLKKRISAIFETPEKRISANFKTQFYGISAVFEMPGMRISARRIGRSKPRPYGADNQYNTSQKMPPRGRVAPWCDRVWVDGGEVRVESGTNGTDGRSVVK